MDSYRDDIHGLRALGSLCRARAAIATLAALEALRAHGDGIGVPGGRLGWAEWLGFPIIKHIWTSSMTLWAAGWSFLLLALFYLLIDVWGWRRWAFPFVVIGMNAITIYVAYHFVPFRAIAEGIVGGLANHLGRGRPAVIELATVALVWLLLYHMYRQKIFLRI